MLYGIILFELYYHTFVQNSSKFLKTLKCVNVIQNDSFT